PQNADMETLIRILLLELGLLALTMALSVLGQAVILYGAFQKMRGGGFSIAQSFARGFARFLPMMGMLALTLLGAMVAGLLFVVPAVILLTMWYVALPACLIERLGPMESLTRSSFLTRGHRWKVFGIWMLVVVVQSVVQQVLQGALGSGILATAAYGLWLVLSEAYQAIVVAVLYHDLRVAKEGIDVERIAAVFE
ncbi:MAG TPA: hypothetical protein VLX85_07910, partial [Stellaceae bacterium]|nr:hypothetical protein [Stellaceae bacterium]